MMIKLLKSIYEHRIAYESADLKVPLFRITFNEYIKFQEHLLNAFPAHRNIIYDAYGTLPEYDGVNFEVVGNSIFNNEVENDKTKTV